MRKKVSFMLIVMLALLLMAVSTSVFNFHSVKAAPITIYIRPDGSVSPKTAPIEQDGNNYTFTYNIVYPDYYGIVVQKSNIIIDGNFYTLQGFEEEGIGFNLTSMSDVTIKNTNIEDFHYGIWLDSSSSNTVSGNNITNNIFGVYLIESSNYNDISGNTVTNAWGGAGVGLLWSCYDNIVSGNTIANSSDSVWLFVSSDSNDILGNIITNSGRGVALEDSCLNNIVFGNAITNNSEGVVVSDLCSGNTVSGNNITNNDLIGVGLSSSSSNTVSGNTIANSSVGIGLIYLSSSNTVSGNNITNNDNGVMVDSSVSSNRFYHNNFIGNTQQVYIETSIYANIWDDGYPHGGNYWSDYVDVDLYRGYYQNETGSDGIGDNPYTIDADNTDRYPFMNIWSPYDIAVIAAGAARMRIPDPFFGTIMPVVALVENQGTETETFDVSIFYDTTLIGTETVTLDAGSMDTVSFDWNLGALPEGAYTISANASVVTGETNEEDNYFLDGEVRKTFDGEVTADGIVDAFDLFDLSKAYGSTTLSEDINGDGIVDYVDFGLLMIAFGLEEGDPGWNPYADIDDSGSVNIDDYFNLAVAFGQPGSPNWNPYADMNADNKVDTSDLFNLTQNYGKSA